MENLTEKEKIEISTARLFIEFFNRENNTQYQVRLTGTSPDIVCEDPNNPVFFLEITMTEDESGDIAALLGRSQKRSIENLQIINNELDPYRFCLQGQVKDTLLERIQAKVVKDYGSGVGLVVRDTSPLDWDWEMVLEDVSGKIKRGRNPFDRGIWLVSKSGDKIRKIL